MQPNSQTSSGSDMKSNALLARFDNAPVLFDQGQASSLVANLTHAFAAVERIEADLRSGDEIRMQDDFWPQPDSWMARYRPYEVKAGVLMVPIKGILLHDFPYQVSDWATGYIYIQKAIERGLEDPEVRGIAFVISSGGGEVAGNFDLVDWIYEKRSEKPMRAFAAEHAYSAAYSIASAAEKIIVARTGGVGSIGVVTSRVDYTAALEQAGIKIHLIYYGERKVDSYPETPLSKEAERRIQMRVNELGELFVATVARNRGMDADAVRATDAATFTASQSTSNGLADEIGWLDDSVAAFAAELSDRRKGTLTMSAQNNKETVVDQAAVETARSEGFAAGKAEGLTEGRTEGAKAAMTRVNAIMSSEAAATRPTMALKMAINEKFAALDAETVTEMLGDMPEEKVEDAGSKKGADAGTNATGKNFKEAMDNGKNPDLGVPGDKESAGEVPRHQRALAAVLGPAPSKKAS
jgi:capsid assembly protease